MKSKRILLGVTGGIAAYKTPELVRLLVKSGAEVQVLMTPAAHRFVTAETLSTVSQKPVYTQFFKDEYGQWTNHVDLGLWADFMLIAPATANTLGKMANGMADNLLIATYLSARCPVAVSPAMDLDMLSHPATEHNLKILANQGVIVIPAAEGALASGLTGKGRMPEPHELFDFLQQQLNTDLLFSGKKIMVTAGPTYENIDPVRFIGNHSSGKMGYAIAQKFADLGAEVLLVSGPVSLDAPENCKRISVHSAADMLETCMKHAKDMDVIVMAAAVADYTPATVSDEKIKKHEAEFHITLKKTEDILQRLSESRRAGQTIVGFALETHNALEYARQKLQKKNLDMVVMNTLADEGAGFSHDTNKVTLVYSNREESLPLMTKQAVAAEITNAVWKLVNK